MQPSQSIYHHDNQELHAYIAYPKNRDKPCPAVLVAHDWTGLSDFSCQKADMLAELGYIGFALDMFGNGKTGNTNDEKMALISPLMEDRHFLGERIQAAFDALVAQPMVDSNKIAAIGFCFGGLCVLDLARRGTPVQGVVSFHGLLNKPNFKRTNPIHAKILALHGYDDPMVKPEEVNVFCEEMTEAGVDWQVHQYGRTMHAFTNPKANDPSFGTVYDAVAERRSFQAMRDFFREIF
jgi:dienelactone hydrolase